MRQRSLSWAVGALLGVVGEVEEHELHSQSSLGSGELERRGRVARDMQRRREIIFWDRHRPPACLPTGHGERRGVCVR